MPLHKPLLESDSLSIPLTKLLMKVELFLDDFVLKLKVPDILLEVILGEEETLCGRAGARYRRISLLPQLHHVVKSEQLVLAEHDQAE